LTVKSNIPREKKTKCESQASCFKEQCKFSMEQIEVRKAKKFSKEKMKYFKKTTWTKNKKNSLKNNEFSLGKSSSSLGEKGSFFEEQCISLRKGPNLLRNNHVLNHFAIITISCLFLYRLIAYHWKGLEKGYNFVVESTSIKIHMKKNYDHTKFRTHLFLEKHGCSLRIILQMH
jgi:hypothetical protein